MQFLRDQFMEMKLQAKPTKVMVLTNDRELVDEALDQCRDVPLLVLTNLNPPSDVLMMRKGVQWKKLAKPPLPGFDVLRQVKDMVVAASAEGFLRSGDRVLCAISSGIEQVIVFDMANAGVVGLRDALSSQVNIQILERAAAIAIQISREGREGFPAGALLVVGDAERVLQNSEETIRSPFTLGCDPASSIMDEKNWNTVKNYAVLDGALIISGEGYAVSAGRYLVMKDIKRLGLQEGLGGRHLAAASITAITRAVAIVVSTSGTIRIYKGGVEVYKIKAV